MNRKITTFSSRLLLVLFSCIFLISLRTAFTYADSDTVYYSLEEAGGYLREHLLKHEETIALKYFDSTGSIDEVWKTLYAKAVEHTGNPKEGDYLNCSIDGYNITGNSLKKDGGLLFNLTYTVNYRTTLAQEKKVDSEVDKIRADLKLKGKSDFEKVQLIYDYICKTVRYDYTNLNVKTNRLKYTAYAALFNKTCVCQGYTQLLYRMLLEENIDCRTIDGHTVKDGVVKENDIGHVWSIVKLDGVYFNLDATWDEGQSNYKYFLLSDKTFNVDHKRDDEYATASFYASYPMTKVDDPYTKDVTGTCGKNGSNLKWSYSKAGVLTVSGKGEMADYKFNEQPWAIYVPTMTKIVIEEGVTSIGNYAFYAGKKITEVVLPSTLKRIGSVSLSKCTSLKSLTLNSTEITFSDFAFWNSTELKDIYYPGSKDEYSKKATVCANNDEFKTIKIHYHTHSLPSKPYKTVNATCTEGKSEVYKCKTCSRDVKKELGSALGHKAVKDAAVSPSYIKTGLTEGSHCSRCGEIFKEQTILPMKTLSKVVITSAENTSKGITLKWNKVTGAKGYYIYRDGKLIASIKKGTTVSYTDTKAKTEGKKYTYSVAAYAGKNKGSVSAKKSVTRSAAPSISSLKNSGSGMLTVTWKSGLSNNMEIKIVSGNIERHFFSSASKGSYTLPVPEKGKTYKVYIRTYYSSEGQYVYSAWSLAKSCKVS